MYFFLITLSQEQAVCLRHPKNGALDFDVNQAGMGEGASFPFLQIHLPPWAFVPPSMWCSPHAVATAVLNTKEHVWFAYRPH